MGKHVLLLNGSPRKGGNTETMADALIEGAEASGNTCIKFNLREIEVKPCIGCYGCAAKKGSPCVQKDDMQQIYDALEQASSIVFASPLYWWTFTGPMKNVIDRLFAAAASRGMKMPPKECALLIAAEGKREENFDIIKSYYQTCLVQALNWKDKGMVLAGGVNLVGDVKETEYIGLARQLGASL